MAKKGQAAEVPSPPYQLPEGFCLGDRCDHFDGRICDHPIVKAVRLTAEQGTKVCPYAKLTGEAR